MGRPANRYGELPATAGRRSPGAYRAHGFPGFLIVIDGQSGAGKTTVAGLLAAQLDAWGVPVIPTRQPSDSPMGKLARESTHRLHGLTLTFLMASDRHHHQEHVIVPALRDGLVVVCDRYVLTALVLDQIDGAELGFIETIYQHMITPDVAVLLSCDPVAGRGRAAARGLYSRFQEGGVDAGRVEAALYEQIGERLAARGYPITTMDTTIRSAFQITSDVLDLLRLHLTLPQS